MLRWLTAGESHGEALVGIIEGVPAGVGLTSQDVRDALARDKDVAQGILEAHARIRRASQASEHERMGSTVVAVRVRAHEALLLDERARPVGF